MEIRGKLWAILIVVFEALLTKADNNNFKATLICTKTHMAVYINSLLGDFTGVAYTEGSYKDPDCHREVISLSKFMMKIPYDGCKTKEEKGKRSNVLIVQHHERIMTAEDASFKVVCDQADTQTAPGTIIVTDSMYMVHSHKDHHHHVDDKIEKSFKSLNGNGNKMKMLETQKGVYTYTVAKNKTLTNNDYSEPV